MRFKAGLDGVTFMSGGSRLLGGFYRAEGDSPRPTAILLHGLPGVEKHLDVAYQLRDVGWNCLYFHFRGSWGSHGAYTLDGLADDTRAAVAWVRGQSSVDRDRIALVGASTGSYPALLCAADDPDIRAVAGISPLIEPSAFQFPDDMAGTFANMLSGVTARDLQNRWRALPRLLDSLRKFAPRPLLLVAAERDDIFPPAQYAEVVASFSNVRLIRHAESDHGFSSCRGWLVQTVIEWLVAQLGT